jgi:hypothetical protein
LLQPSFFLFPPLKVVLKRRRFASTEEVTTKATRALKEVLQNGFQECFEKLYKRWQKSATAQENNLEGNVV